MKRWTVFYANLLYGEFDDFPTGLPDGAYMRKIHNGQAHWYQRKWASHVPLNTCDLPSEVKAIALLMS